MIKNKLISFNTENTAENSLAWLNRIVSKHMKKETFTSDEIRRAGLPVAKALIENAIKTSNLGKYLEMPDLKQYFFNLVKELDCEVLKKLIELAENADHDYMQFFASNVSQAGHKLTFTLVAQDNNTWDIQLVFVNLDKAVLTIAEQLEILIYTLGIVRNEAEEYFAGLLEGLDLGVMLGLGEKKDLAYYGVISRQIPPQDEEKVSFVIAATTKKIIELDFIFKNQKSISLSLDEQLAIIKKLIDKN
ncbi:MAG: hypothetical protein HQ564_01090 [Candidatus Saganbacteria bacterium]|nr:hypothetical protein [Candidatus Saganbacteria bacterium]